MAKKVFFGLAAVGGGLYLYDQNVLPIFPRDNKGNAFGVSQAGPPKELKQDFRKLGDDTRDLGSQIKKTVNGSVHREGHGDVQQVVPEIGQLPEGCAHGGGEHREQAFAQQVGG